jgi:hypothetical protein
MIFKIYKVSRIVLTSQVSYVEILIEIRSSKLTVKSNVGRSAVSNETKSTVSFLFKERDFLNNPYYILFVSVVSFYLPLFVMIYVYIRDTP